MRLDRYLPEERRRREGRGTNWLLIVGVVLGLHLCVGVGWSAVVAFRERNAPPRYVVRFFDIGTYPTASSAPAEPPADSSDAALPEGETVAAPPASPEPGAATL